MAVAKGIFDSHVLTRIYPDDPLERPATGANVMCVDEMGGYEFVRTHIARMLGFKGDMRLETYSLSDPDNLTDEALAWFEDRIKASTFSFVYDKLVICDAAASASDLGMVYRGRNDNRVFGHKAVIADLHRFAGEQRQYGPCELAQRAYSDLTETESLKKQCRSEDIVDLYANDDKATKRLKTEARPFRSFALGKRPLKVWVEDFGEIGNLARDGLIAINRKLFNLCINNTRLGEFDQVVGAALRFYLSGLPGWNGRAWGYLEVHENTTEEVRDLLMAEGMYNPVTTQLMAMAKGNFIVVDTDEDWDIRLATPCLGSQMFSTKVWYAIGLEPQGAKPAVTDGQTFMNHPFMIDTDMVREIMEDDAEREFTETVEGLKMRDIAELADNRFTTAGGWDEDERDKKFRWSVRNWILHGADYRWSPWLTKSIGTTWIGRLRLGDDTKFRVRLPNGMRAQIISISCAMMHPEVAFEIGRIKNWEERQIMWSEKLQMAIVRDEDWIDIVIPSHGGCDFDDFFLMQQVTLTGDHWCADFQFGAGEQVILVTRNPNHRHEWSLWRPILGHFPTWIWTKHDGEEVSYPEIYNNNWPSQIIDAVNDGEIELLNLPSMTGTGATRDDDKDFVEEWREDIVSELFDLSAKGIRPDKTIAKRIRRPKDPRHPKGRQEYLKGRTGEPTKRLELMKSITGHYEKRLTRWTQRRLEDPDPQLPEWLGPICAQLTPDLKDMAANTVSRVRSAQGEANRQTQDIIDEFGAGVTLNVKEIQEHILKPLFNERLAHWSDFDRAMLALGMWRSTLIRKTITTQQYTDQVIMGTFVLKHLTQALYMLGIGSRVDVVYGALERVQDVVWAGLDVPNQWDVRCVGCSRHFMLKSIGSLKKYWEADQFCNSCRTSAAEEAS
jgi:hypothetical protein